MVILENINVNFGTRKLFDDVNLRVGGKDRLSLVGVNGAGKSTLLKVIMGLFNYDSGKVIKSRHSTYGYLPQETVRLKGKILYDEVYDSADNIKSIEDELREIENELKSFEDKESEDYMDLLTTYSELQEQFTLLEGHKLKSKIEKLLIGLGFENDEFGKDVGIFSGGWQMRIELAKLLLKNPSVLLLDEPTNHLDFESLVWFEKYLIGYKGAIVLVSHDKEFLNNISRKTAEIHNGVLTMFGGNYAFYVSEKEKRREMLENQFRNQQKYLQQQEKFIERFRYKATKARAVQSRIKMIEKIDKVELEQETEKIKFRFPPAVHSGRILVEMSDLTKSYDGIKNVLDGISLSIERGEKIAVVGKNGAGKSTLTRILAGIENYNSGGMKYGYNVVPRYFAQNQAEEMDESKTAFEIMLEVNSGENVTGIRNILGGFLFHGDDVDKKIGVLSGGEKSRLALAKMLIEPSNLLILDEPTNHLDIHSKEVLQKALSGYEGTVIIVSHDREFIDGIIDKIIEVKKGGIKTYIGKSSEYLNVLETENAEQEQKEAKPEKEISAQYKEGIENKKRKKEFTKIAAPVKKKISEIEKELGELERKKIYLEQEMSKTDFFKDSDFAVEIKFEYLDLSQKIENLTASWEKEAENLSELEKKYLNN
ncbi:MAG: ABC-F family ATP-binding cassette domain-containing protein [Bacteroidetes bacterium]|nr:ABC-F family ATP-binding cassette domain-containing protein [Bacteroidota bacterium]